MNELDKLKIEHARLNGEFIGFCGALLWWDIPAELRVLVKEQINRLEEQYQKQKI